MILRLALILPLLLCLSVTACGKKPSTVVLSDDDSRSDDFPRPYPDPATDPAGSYAPEGRQK